MITLKFVGDIMLGERFEKFKRGVKSKIENNNINPFEFCNAELKKSNLNIGNLECVVSTKSKKKFPFSEFMRISEDKLKFLSANNIKVVNIANNHIFDHGKEAFEELKVILERNGIKYFGFGEGAALQTDPLIIEVDNKTIGFLGYDLSNTSKEEFQGKRNLILNILNSINKNFDILILSLHWGYEYTDIPTTFMIEAGRKFFENGVDIIYGHHPHILQGITKINNKIFAPSLGNFIFDDEREWNRFTGIMTVKIASNNELDYSFTPYFINKNFQPVPSPEKEKEYNILVEKLNEQIDLFEQGTTDIDDEIILQCNKGHSLNKKRVKKEVMANYKNYLPFLYPIFKDKIIEKRIKRILK